MNRKDDELERRYYTLEELLEGHKLDGHQYKPQFIVFDIWLALPFFYGAYTFNGAVLLFTLFAMIFDIWIRVKHKGTPGIGGWIIKKRRVWLTGTKKMPRHHGSR